jgi:hypothetical protein
MRQGVIAFFHFLPARLEWLALLLKIASGQIRAVSYQKATAQTAVPTLAKKTKLRKFSYFILSKRFGLGN